MYLANPQPSRPPRPDTSHVPASPAAGSASSRESSGEPSPSTYPHMLLQDPGPVRLSISARWTGPSGAVKYVILSDHSADASPVVASGKFNCTGLPKPSKLLVVVAPCGLTSLSTTPSPRSQTRRVRYCSPPQFDKPVRSAPPSVIC